MDIQPRWRKVIADLLSNKTRTILVVLSVAIGVFAVGFVTTAFVILLKDMDAEYKAANPSEASIYTDTYKEELLETLRKVPGVAMVEGRTSIFARNEIEPGKKVLMFVVAVPPVTESQWASYTAEQRQTAKRNVIDMQIDRLRPEGVSSLPPLGDHEIFIERSSAAAMKVKPGDEVSIELSSGRMRTLRVAGIVYDITSPPYVFTNWLSGYVNPDTMVWLEDSRDFNTVKLRVSENNTDEDHVKAVARAVADKIEKSGLEVYFTFVLKPGRHWGSDMTQALLMVMGILGFLSVLLSGFLVLNTISALLTQHIRHIGIMKSVGGRRYQIIGMYIVLVITFGLVALLVAGAPGILAGYYIAKFVASFLNFNVSPLHAPTEAVVLEILVAIGTPLLAALFPIINGTRVTIREAVSDYGLGKGRFGKNIIDHVLEQVRFLTRPQTISLRNTFRRKGRLALTLFTLTLGGATFIAVFNTQSAISNAIDETMGYYLSDVSVSLNETHRMQQLEQIVFSVPGVKQVEGWGYASTQLLSPDEKTSNSVDILAPPSTAKLIKPVITDGRWLVPGDENALVIGNALLKVRPDLKVGDRVRMEINGQKYSFDIVGVYRMAGMAINPYVFANFDYISKITHQPDQYASLRLVTEPHDTATQERVAKALDAAFTQAGISVQEISTRTQIESSNTSTVIVIVAFLLIMALLIAVVGGLGLMGTMSMNVIERTREIGVMRATGASDGTVLSIVLVEGVFIGVLSWLLGVILALPISLGLNFALGDSLLSSSLPFRMNLAGYLLWLVIVLVISALASAIPARNASRLTIREVLAYE